MGGTHTYLDYSINKSFKCQKLWADGFDVLLVMLRALEKSFEDFFG